MEKEEFDRYYDQFGSKNFKLQSGLFRDYKEEILNLYFRSIDLVLKLTSVAGVIGGFGFTAFQFVDNTWVFVCGEFAITSAILYAIYSVHLIYKNETNNLVTAFNVLRTYFGERNGLFKATVDSYLETKSIDPEKIQELCHKDEKLLDILGEKKEKSLLPEMEKIIFVIIVLLFMGSILILVSFIISDITTLIPLFSQPWIYVQMVYSVVALVFITLQGPLYYRWHNFPNKRTERILHVKETLLNTLGSIIGWAAGYYLIFYRLKNGVNIASLGVSDLVIFLIAFYGMTGYLPHTLIEKLRLGK